MPDWVALRIIESQQIAEDSENIKLKRRIIELEDELSPKPLFVYRLAIVSPDQVPPSTLGTSIKVRQVTKFLNGFILYVTKNINKCLNSLHKHGKSLQSRGTYLKEFPT
jgi:hypothetical protein